MNGSAHRPTSPYDSSDTTGPLRPCAMNHLSGTHDRPQSEAENSSTPVAVRSEGRAGSNVISSPWRQSAIRTARSGPTQRHRRAGFAGRPVPPPLRGVTRSGAGGVSSSWHDGAAVGAEYLAAVETRQVGREEQRGGGDLFRCTQSV